MTEREMFEEAFKKVNSGVSFWLNTWSDEDNDYGHLTASWGWHMWQASASREGYAVVNKKKLAKVLNCVTDEWLIDTDAMNEFKEIELLVTDEVEAMTGAAP